MASLGIIVASNVDILDKNLTIQRSAKITLLWEQKKFGVFLLKVILTMLDHFNFKASMFFLKIKPNLN